MCRVNIVLYLSVFDSSFRWNLKKRRVAAAIIFICLYAKSFPRQLRGPAYHKERVRVQRFIGRMVG